MPADSVAEQGGSKAEARGLLLQGPEHTVEMIALILLPVAILMCAYALVVFIWRAKAIGRKQASPC